MLVPESLRWARARTRALFSTEYAVTVLVSVAIGALGAITGVVLARILGPSDRGTLASMQVIPMMLLPIAAAGIPQACHYYVARDPRKSPEILTASLRLVGLFSPVAVILGMGLVLLSAPNDEVRVGGALLLLAVPAQALLNTAYSGARGGGRIRVWNALRGVPAVTWLLVVVLLGLIGRIDPLNIAAWYAASVSVLCLLGVYFGARDLRSSVDDAGSSDCTSPDVEAPSRRQLLGYAGPGLGQSIAGVLSLRFDVLWLTRHSEASEIGLYAAAVAWGSLAAPLVQAIALTRARRVVSAADKATEARRMLTSSAVVVALVGVGGAGAGFLVFEYIFGSEYSDAIGLAMLMSIAVPIRAAGFVLGETLRALGDSVRPMVSEIAGALVTVVLVAVLVPRHDALGAAIATLLSYSVVAGIQTVFAIRSIRRQVVVDGV